MKKAWLGGAEVLGSRNLEAAITGRNHSQIYLVEDHLNWTAADFLKPYCLVAYPTTTNDGTAVTVDQTARDGSRKLHIWAPDRQEIYFEVVAFQGFIDPLDDWEKVLTHLIDVQQRLGAHALDLSQNDVKDRPGITGRLRWLEEKRWMERLFSYVDTASITLRIVMDPRSATNEEILRRLVIDWDHGLKRP